MDYSIQQLTLIHQSIHSSVDYKTGGTQKQRVILKVLNSEHRISKGGLPSRAIPDGLQDATDNGGCGCDGYSLKTFHNSIQFLGGCVDQRGSTGWDGRAESIQGEMP